MTWLILTAAVVTFCLAARAVASQDISATIDRDNRFEEEAS